ncbi:MAG: SDR family oxidoreductase [Bacteroidia bacterium]|nr:SDR family oxidoreductase [Bacteroidia bacterium]MDW8346821.1 SDR family oxidoreductase [Bacteroidia bacterium]
MNKNIVISGITKGIGLSIAMRFVETGKWNAYGFAKKLPLWDYISLPTCQSVIPEPLHKSFSKEIHYEFEASTGLFCQDEIDVREINEIVQFATKLKQLVQKAPYYYQKTDVLVNNVGIYRTGSLFSEPDTQWHELLQVNLNAAYYLTKYLYPTFTKGTHIFNICSIASKEIVQDAPSYSITKMALYGLHKAMMQELEPLGVKVTAILPGAVLTDSWRDTPIEIQNKIIPASDIASLIWEAYHLAPQSSVKEIEVKPLNF